MNFFSRDTWYITYFTLSNKLKDHFEETKEANEIGNQIDEISEEESCYWFNEIVKLTKQMLRYYDMRVSKICKLPEHFCSPKSIVNFQIRDILVSCGLF